MKKLLLTSALVAALILTLITPAVAVVSGWIEDNDAYFRIEIHNEWGNTGSATLDVPAGEILEVTFTIQGLSDIDGLSFPYTAYLGTSANWLFKTESPNSVNITGDGTYRIRATFDDDVDAGQVLVVDIAGLQEDLGMEPGYDHPLTITASAAVLAADSAPKTHDQGTMLLWIAFGVAALLCTAVVIRLKTMKKSEN